MSENQAGTLFIVATPIGNLGDISPRALKTLGQVDYIAAEDTRHSARLLKHFNITTPLIAYHDHSDQRRQQKIMDLLQSGCDLALVSDAGTPLIADPGYALVKRARASQLAVIAIPGPCALISALSIAGLPSDRFIFEGFLPVKASARRAHLSALAAERRTLIFYESTHRILDALTDMSQSLGPERHIAIARELTKTYETLIAGTVANVLAIVNSDANQQKGEFVVVVSPCEKQSTTLMDQESERVMKILLADLPLKQAASLGARLTGLKKRDLYQWGLAQADK
ncbi:MAG: 16S rRNA (cytidine(1402)-2'-O)-methyltransferase [Pseudomonadota bacterium]